MKAKKLLERVRRFLDADTQTQLEQIKSIRKTLKQLKEKERELQDELSHEQEPEARESLQNKLDVIYAQRKKGLDQIRQLKEGQDDE
jgi:3-methyladenine DNA glycosylase AlkC